MHSVVHRFSKSVSNLKFCCKKNPGGRIHDNGFRKTITLHSIIQRRCWFNFWKLYHQILNEIEEITLCTDNQNTLLRNTSCNLEISSSRTARVNTLFIWSDNIQIIWGHGQETLNKFDLYFPPRKHAKPLLFVAKSLTLIFGSEIYQRNRNLATMQFRDADRSASCFDFEGQETAENNIRSSGNTASQSLYGWCKLLSWSKA